MLVYKSGSTGEEINLSEEHIKAHIKTAGLYDYDWNVNEIELKTGIEVDGFQRNSKQYELTLDFRGSKEERAEAAEKFFRITERDVIEKISGRLYFKDHYLKCYVIGSKYENAGRARIVRKTASVYAPKPVWITEVSRSFQKIGASEGSKEYLDYEYDYNYDYTMPYGGDVIWNVDHYAQCEFLMTVFGPCVDPRVVINGHPYQVYVTLDENEYLQIDSRPNANTVVKYAANGIQQDVYDMRAKQESVFEPITAGNVRVVWPGDFGFDLTLFCERSEPRWKIQGS